MCVKFKNMEIKLTKGIETLQFGMTKEEVITLLGKPNIEKPDPDDADELLLIYNELKITLTFYLNEGGKFGYVRSNNPNISFNGQKVIDTKVTDAKALFEKCKLWEKETYDFFTTYFNEENWIILNVQYDRVFEIELGVPIKNNEFQWKD